MRTRPLGSSGLEVTVVGLGCNNFGGRTDEASSRAVIDAALDAGVTFFDTADVYGGGGGSEEIIGRALVGRRDQVVLATKFGHDLGGGEPARGARPYIREAIEASLRRLQTDSVDLYQYHRPDGITPIEETLGALQELVAEGKVRAIGSSNFSPRSSRRRTRSPAAAAGRRSRASRASIRGSRAARRPSCCLRASGSASGSFRTSRSRAASSPASTGAASPHRRARASTAASWTRTASRASTAWPTGVASTASRCSRPRSAASRHNRASRR